MSTRRFEHKVVSLSLVDVVKDKTGSVIENALNEAGRRGWEMVGTRDHPMGQTILFLMKRRVA